MPLLCNPKDCPASIRNSNLKFEQFPGYWGLRIIPQPDRTTKLSAQLVEGITGVADSNQESDYSMSGDSEQEPRTNADFAWQERTPPEGSSLATYNPTPSEDAAPNNEIDGLMDVLDDMIARTPAAAPEVPGPRALRNITAELDNDDRDFTEALCLLQAPQSQGPERLPFRNQSNVTSPQRHLPLKSPTHERIRFKLVAKTRRPGTYQPPWANSTAGASRDSPSTAGTTKRGN